MPFPQVIVVSSIRLLADGIAGQLRDWGYVTFTFDPRTDWDIATMRVRFRRAVLVLDSSAGTLDAARGLLKSHALAGAVLLDQTEDDYVRSPLASIVAIGLLDASADTADLLRAIESIARGIPYVSPRLALGESGRRLAGLEQLTPRETQIANLLARKVAYREICSVLSIRRGTLKSHVRKIYRKVGARTRNDLTAIQKTRSHNYSANAAR